MKIYQDTEKAVTQFDSIQADLAQVDLVQEVRFGFVRSFNPVLR